MKNTSRFAFLIPALTTMLAMLWGHSNAHAAFVRVATIQYVVQDDNSVGWDDDRIDSFVRDAAANGAQIVVAPETAFYRYAPWDNGSGATMGDLANEYESIKNRFTDLADELRIGIVIGLREPHNQTHIYNTALFLGPDGSVLGKHRKVVPSSDESAFTTAGTSADAFDTPFGRVGMLICKDLKSGSWYQAYNDQNIDLLIVIAGDPDGTSFLNFDEALLVSGTYGILSNQDISHGTGAGNSAWGYPDGSVTFLGDGEQVFYTEFDLPVSVPLPGSALPLISGFFGLLVRRGEFKKVLPEKALHILPGRILPFPSSRSMLFYFFHGL